MAYSDIQIIKREIAHLQELSNKGNLSSNDKLMSFNSVIRPALDRLKFDFTVTNGDLFFPIHREPLFRRYNIPAIGKKKKNQFCNYFGIINTKDDNVISCVDDDYVLVTNKEILEYAKLLLCHLYERDGRYSVEICRQTFDKCKSDFDVMPLFEQKNDNFSNLKDVRGVEWTFFLRVSNTYSTNVKKYYAGFANDKGQKVILKDENGVSLTIKNDRNIGNSISRDFFDIIIDKNLGNLNKMQTNFIYLLRDLNSLKIPDIFSVFVFCEDFEIKESVIYVEKINKEIKDKGNNNISADKKSRRQKHFDKLRDFFKLCKYNNGSNYTAYDLFETFIHSEFIKEEDKQTDGETMYSNYYYPVKVGVWLQNILQRLNKISSIVISNYEIIKRINAVESKWFSSFENDLNDYLKKTIEKKVKLVKECCNDKAFVTAFTIQEEFTKNCSPDSFFKAKAKLGKLLNDSSDVDN